MSEDAHDNDDHDDNHDNHDHDNGGSRTMLLSTTDYGNDIKVQKHSQVSRARARMSALFNSQ